MVSNKVLSFKKEEKDAWRIYPTVAILEEKNSLKLKKRFIRKAANGMEIKRNREYFAFVIAGAPGLLSGVY